MLPELLRHILPSWIAVVLIGTFAPGCLGGGSDVPLTGSAGAASIGGAGIKVSVLDALTLQPISGATVFSGANGTPVTTDANGLATVQAATAGTWDIHVIKQGYVWRSIYGTSLSQLTIELLPKPKGGSYINLNITPAGTLFGTTLDVMIRFSNNQFSSAYGGTCTAPTPPATAYACSVKLDRVPPGTVIAADVWAFDVKTFGNPGQDPLRTVLGGVLAAKGQVYVTNSTPGVSPAALTATFPAGGGGTFGTVLTIGQVVPPAGITYPFAAARSPADFNGNLGQIISGNLASSVNQVPLNGLVPTALGTNILAWVGTSGTFPSWSFTQRAMVGGVAADCVARILTLPGVQPQNAMGATQPTILFTPATGTFSGHKLEISSAVNGLLWEIYAPPTVNSVTLPMVPAGIAPILQAGSTYTLTVKAFRLDFATYDQALAITQQALANTNQMEEAAVQANFIR